jgi:hypothetical protein
MRPRSLRAVSGLVSQIGLRTPSTSSVVIAPTRRGRSAAASTVRVVTHWRMWTGLLHCGVRSAIIWSARAKGLQPLGSALAALFVYGVLARADLPLGGLRRFARLSEPNR